MLCIIRGVGAACDIGPYEFADELDALPLVKKEALVITIISTILLDDRGDGRGASLRGGASPHACLL